MISYYNGKVGVCIHGGTGFVSCPMHVVTFFTQCTKYTTTPWEGTILPLDQPCIHYNSAKIYHWALFISLLLNIYITCVFSMEIHGFLRTRYKSLHYTYICVKKLSPKINYTKTRIKVFLCWWSKPRSVVNNFLLVNLNSQILVIALVGIRTRVRTVEGH